MAYPFEPSNPEKHVPNMNTGLPDKDYKQQGDTSLEKLFGLDLKPLEWRNLTYDYRMSLVVGGVDSRHMTCPEHYKHTKLAAEKIRHELVPQKFMYTGSYTSRDQEGAKDLIFFDYFEYSIHIGLMFLEDMYEGFNDEIFSPDNFDFPEDFNALTCLSELAESFFLELDTMRTLEEELLSTFLGASYDFQKPNLSSELIHRGLIIAISMYLWSHGARPETELVASDDTDTPELDVLAKLLSDASNKAELYQELDDFAVEKIRTFSPENDDIARLWEKIIASGFWVQPVEVRYKKQNPETGHAALIPSSLHDVIFWSSITFLQGLNPDIDLNLLLSNKFFSEKYDFEAFMSLVAEYNFSADFEGEDAFIDLYDSLIEVALTTDERVQEISLCIDTTMQVAGTIYCLALGLVSLDGNVIKIGVKRYIPYTENRYHHVQDSSEPGLYN